MKYILIALLFTACNSVVHNEMNINDEKKNLIAADSAFSALSEREGMNRSFLSYMDSNVVMLRSNSMPLKGIDTMRKRFAARPDTSFKLTWKPLYADVAASGELGYTYGIFHYAGHNGETEDGTYCTVWKKDKNGNWKFVLDTGNEGLKPKESQH